MRPDQFVSSVRALCRNILRQAMEKVTYVVNQRGGDQSVSGLRLTCEKRRLQGMLENGHAFAEIGGLPATFK